MNNKTLGRLQTYASGDTYESRILHQERRYHQERLGVLAAPRMVRSTFLNARLRSAGGF